MGFNKAADKLIRSNIPHFGLHITFAFLLYLAVRLTALVPALFMKRIIDTYIPDKNIRATIICIIVFVILPVINAGISAFQQHRIAVTGRRLGQLLFVKCFDKIIHQPLSFFDKNNSGELASYCRSEAMEYVLLWIMDLPKLLSNLAVSIVIFVLLLRINPLIAVLQLLYIPILLLPSKWFGKKTEQYSEYMEKNRAESGGLITDTFRGIRTVKSLRMEEGRVQRLSEINRSNAVLWSHSTALENLHGVWITVLVDSLFIGITFSIGAYFVITGSITLGSLVLFLNYMPQFFDIVKELSGMNFNFHKLLGKHKRLFEILSMSDERDIECKGLPFSCEKGIAFRDVTFAYDEARGNVFERFSADFEAGRLTVITGPSGAGKSTLLHLMTGDYLVTTGEVTFEGTPVSKIRLEDLRSNIAYVSQEPYLFPGSLRDNLALALPDGDDERFLAVLKDVSLDGFVSGLPEGLNTEIGENGVQLSGGQKQRIAIAQGLLRGCGVLLLDEITSNLDAEAEEDVCRLISALKEEKKLTVIAVTHRQALLRYADDTLAV